jgi:hypothetical protein
MTIATTEDEPNDPTGPDDSTTKVDCIDCGGTGTICLSCGYEETECECDNEFSPVDCECCGGTGTLTAEE